MVADHLGHAAAIGADSGLESDELEAIRRPRPRGARASRRRRRRPLFEPGGPRRTTRRRWRSAARTGAATRTCAPGSPRSSATSRSGSGRVDRAVELWDECLEYHRGQEDLARVGDLHRKIGAGLWNKGDREGSIGHYQRGIDLLKDGPPCLELVRLYEEAASLYMHTGDNMLAIYASEKALRLAERLEEAAAASRAHGIFGRVFGRIGDSERARENLERSVELARDSDPVEAIRALLALGYHFEISEADYAAAADAYGEALQIAERIGDLPNAGRAARVALDAGAPPRRMGRGRVRDRDGGRPGRARGPHRQALLPAPAARRPALARAATSRAPSARCAAPPSWPTRSAAPRSASRRSTGSRPRCATAASTPTPTRPSRPRSTPASAPASSPSPSRRPRRARSTRRSGARRTRPRPGRGGDRPRRAPPLPGRQRRRARGDAASRPPSGTRSPRRARRGRRSAVRWMPSASSGSPSGSRRGRPASIPEGYARPSFSYSRRKPSNRRRWPCSSWRIAITMSCVTGSMPSVNSMIRE